MTCAVRRSRLVTVAVTVLAALAAVLGVGGQVQAAASRRTASGNPLAAGPLGVYKGTQDGVWPAYQRATGDKKALLAKVALQPRVRWIGQWIPDDQVFAKLRSDIAQEQSGDPDVVVPIAVFREFPRGEDAIHQPITTAQQRSYHRWVRNAARAIGDARVAMILEPDLAVGLDGWRPSVRLDLVRDAARTFAALPHTTVYLDASDSDWLPVPAAVAMLRSAGIRFVRGFALGATHYGGTAANIEYGAQLVAALAKAGAPGKHFVIDTADNGRPFTWLQYWAAHPGGDFDNAEVCRTRSQQRCVTLGIPPTTDVANARWGLPDDVRDAACEHVDAYLWFGRPWLTRQAAPFSLARTLSVARTTRY